MKIETERRTIETERKNDKQRYVYRNGFDCKLAINFYCCLLLQSLVYDVMDIYSRLTEVNHIYIVFAEDDVIST